MFAGKPVIGIAGGIGSGKSFVANLFSELGCLVIDSDQQVRAAYRDPRIKAALREWWDGEVFSAENEINRSAIARKVFADPADRQRLEGLLHPWVNEARRRAMEAAANDPQVLAFIWDTPLLFEMGLARECDAVVFVESSVEDRMERLRQRRGWDEAAMAQREKLQMPLDKKVRSSHYVLTNTADADYARGQVRELLSRILAGSSNRPSQG